jgi:hypothetical protein
MNRTPKLDFIPIKERKVFYVEKVLTSKKKKLIILIKVLTFVSQFRQMDKVELGNFQLCLPPEAMSANFHA